MDHKQVENVEYFNDLGSMRTTYAKFTHEIKYRFVKAKAAFNKKNVHQQIGLKFNEETSEVLHLEQSYVWCWNLDASASRSEKLGNFLKMLLE